MSQVQEFHETSTQAERLFDVPEDFNEAGYWNGIGYSRYTTYMTKTEFNEVSIKMKFVDQEKLNIEDEPRKYVKINGFWHLVFITESTDIVWMSMTDYLRLNPTTTYRIGQKFYLANGDVIQRIFFK